MIGYRPYEFMPADYGKPCVVAGFEPLDILQAILMNHAPLAEGRCEVENQDSRVVSWEGNLSALRSMAEVFEHREQGHDVGAFSFLYPMLERERQRPEGVVEEVQASVYHVPRGLVEALRPEGRGPMDRAGGPAR
ncbi:Hydrogenase maturation factor-like protein [Rubrobacter xylanophilus DSM 9941]|uniref:Hydrogenase maturation factor-like protein n=1 Tax=Rubrobacter xylanophilus (strain DSM 9941 / JCM 11954 / NBRC 16129 / PRD-1) TaxID=266117 RepID=Q1AUA4_RUBXD|nr:Hydrogenase maturation factor-like protein [Rubrobacter xylanophilus DSM 9941]